MGCSEMGWRVPVLMSELSITLVLDAMTWVHIVSHPPHMPEHGISHLSLVVTSSYLGEMFVRESLLRDNSQLEDTVRLIEQRHTVWNIWACHVVSCIMHYVACGMWHSTCVMWHGSCAYRRILWNWNDPYERYLNYLKVSHVCVDVCGWTDE